MTDDPTTAGDCLLCVMEKAEASAVVFRDDLWAPAGPGRAAGVPAQRHSLLTSRVATRPIVTSGVEGVGRDTGTAGFRGSGIQDRGLVAVLEVAAADAFEQRRGRD